LKELLIKRVNGIKYLNKAISIWKAKKEGEKENKIIYLKEEIMKTILYLILILLIVTSCVTIQGNRIQSTKYRHYDNHGRYEGYSICNDYGCRHYDKQSRYKGHTK